MKFHTQYNSIKVKKRILSRDSLVDELAYTPLHIQIKRMLDAGESLQNYRRRVNQFCLYSSDEVEKEDSSVFAPVYKPDMVQAQELLNSAPVTPDRAVEVTKSSDLINNSEVTETNSKSELVKES